MAKEKILLADDEVELTKAIKIILEHNGYDVDVVENGLEVLEKLKKTHYQLIILDIMMPKLDGIKTIMEIRNLKIKTPVLFLTAKTLVDDVVMGLDAGANDYLTKPFNKKELLARIRVLIRDEKDELCYIGYVVFDKENLLLSNNGISLYLSDREAKVLTVLDQYRNEWIQPNELKEKIGISADTDDNIIRLYISYLKNKFKTLDRNVSFILNEKGCMLKCEQN